MSFSRSKSSRFGDIHHKPIKKHVEHSSTRTIVKLTNNSQDNPMQPVSEEKHVETKISSHSQPSSNTSLNRSSIKSRASSPRPCSGGDVLKRNCANKPKDGHVDHTVEQSDDEFESTTLLPNDCVRKDENPIFSLAIVKADNGDTLQTDDKNGFLAGEPRQNSIPNLKLGSSIPLRTKSGAPSPKLESRRPAPKSPKLPSNIPTRGGSPRVAFSPTSESKSLPPTAAKRNLENMFQTKKRKWEQLKREILDKQRPFLETYNALVDLKNKLEDAGKHITLEEVKLVDCGINYGLSESNFSGAGETPNPVIDPEVVDDMKTAVQNIPQALFNVAQEIFQKRLILLEAIERVSTHMVTPDDLKSQIVFFKNDSTSLKSMLDETFSQQAFNIDNLIRQWKLLYASSDHNGIIREEQMQHQLSQFQSKISGLESQLHDAIRQKQDSGDKADSIITDLKDKIRRLEQDLHSDKSVISDYKEKYSQSDHKGKTMKNRITELEKKNKELDLKLHESSNKQRASLELIKNNEIKWNKEKEELITKSKHDRQMLEKLTKDRSYFETRVKILEERLEEQETKYLEMESQLKIQAESSRDNALEEKTQKESMQQKYDHMKDQLVEMEMRSKQAADLVVTRNMFEPNETDGLRTEKETELYTELIATRVSLKSAEDKILTYNREKLRFIDSIQSLQGDPQKDQDQITKNMIHNVEQLSEMESKIAEYDEIICNQKIEISNLKVDIENLRQKSTTVNFDYTNSKDSDLKLMLHEGKVKLEQSLKKSLEYEHKLIRYEHDLNKQSKQIFEMENLLKIRDGLIAMMKSKKDELQMENDSLSKYANEVRGQLMQCKEEVGVRTETVSELTSALDSKSQLCQQLQKKIEELQTSLSTNNEKRFRLQESIGVMEKQLQSSQTLSDEPDLHSRYDAGRKPEHEIKSNHDIKNSDNKYPVPYSANRSCNVNSEALAHYKALNNNIEKNLTKHQYLNNFNAEAIVDKYSKKWKKTCSIISEVQDRWKYVNQNLSILTRHLIDSTPNRLLHNELLIDTNAYRTKFTKSADLLHIPLVTGKPIKPGRFSILQYSASNIQHATPSLENISQIHTNINLSKSEKDLSRKYTKHRCSVPIDRSKLEKTNNYKDANKMTGFNACIKDDLHTSKCVHSNMCNCIKQDTSTDMDNSISDCHEVIMASSLHKINEDITSSINLLSSF